ncbi:hypothetical protein ACLMJK_007698 [Lecanora helva]
MPSDKTRKRTHAEMIAAQWQDDIKSSSSRPQHDFLSTVGNFNRTPQSSKSTSTATVQSEPIQTQGHNTEEGHIRDLTDHESDRLRLLAAITAKLSQDEKPEIVLREIY